MPHGLFHVLGVLVTFGVVVVERFLGAWHLDVRKVKKADRFTDVLPLLTRPDVTIRIEELAQLGQEDIACQPHNLLDDGGYGRAVGVRLDDATTILDTLGRSSLVLNDAQLVHPLLRVTHDLDIVLVRVVEVRKARVYPAARVYPGPWIGSVKKLSVVREERAMKHPECLAPGH